MKFTPVLFLLLPLAVHADDHWSEFRGPNGTGLSKAAGLPLTWSESENIRWKTPIHDKGWSSPVVLGNQVWVTTAREEGTEFFAVCVDRQSGKIVHDLKLFTDDDPPDIRKYNSFASPTPVIEAGRVWVHFGTHGTACLDTASGKVVWQRTDLKCNHWRGPASSPIIHGDLLILTFDGHDVQFITALDKSTGKTVWRRDRNINYGTDDGDLKKAFSTPSVLKMNDNALIVSPSAAATTAYDAATGDEVWRVYHGGMNEAPRPIFGHGLAFLTSGHQASVLAVRLGRTGELTQADIVWRTPRGAPSRPTPLLLGEHLFMISDQGVASCLDAKTGKFHWQERIGKATSASPVFAEGRLYFIDEEGSTYVVAAKPEFELLAVNKLDAGCRATPAPVGDAIYLRTLTHLYCIGK